MNDMTACRSEMSARPAKERRRLEELLRQHGPDELVLQ